MPESDLTRSSWRRRPRSAGVVFLAVAWFCAARLISDRSASGLTLRFGESSLHSLVMAAFLLFLALIGLLLLASAGGSQVRLRDLMGLPRRPSNRREFALGLALGWGATLLVLLPLALSRGLQAQISLTPRTVWLAVVALAALAIFALAEEVVFRGYPYRRLIASLGPTRATIVMSLIYGAVYAVLFETSVASFSIAFLFALLLSLAWLRTHGLWLSWGLHFAWKASFAVLFGLPAAGATVVSSVVDSQFFGPRALVGRDLGPEGSLTAGIAILLAIPVLMRVTRNYAWAYTHAPIVAGGYAVEVKPPAAHTTMEQTGAPPPPLVQILPSTPQSRSAVDPPV